MIVLLRLAARRALIGLSGAVFVAASVPAQAHVKWFAPYIVGAPPQPIGATLTNVWFWTGIALVLVFFLATRAIEKSSAGETILRGMDRITDPLWKRLDDFVRVVIAAFFVAIFAVGGVYLTPDLKTPAEWVSWTQLLIAGLIFSRKTQPLAAARHHRPVAAGAARLRRLPSARLSRARRRRRRLSGAGGVVQSGMAQASLRGAALGRRHRADVVEPRKVRLSRLVLSAGRGEAVPDLRHAARRLHPDGRRRRVHDGLRPDLDAAGAPAVGHRAVRHLQRGRLSVRPHRPDRPRAHHGDHRRHRRRSYPGGAFPAGAQAQAGRRPGGTCGGARHLRDGLLGPAHRDLRHRRKRRRRRPANG